MEGCCPDKIDEILGLRECSLRSVTIIRIGYRQENSDWLVKLKKVCRPMTGFQHGRTIVSLLEKVFSDRTNFPEMRGALGKISLGRLDLRSHKQIHGPRRMADLLQIALGGFEKVKSKMLDRRHIVRMCMSR